MKKSIRNIIFTVVFVSFIFMVTVVLMELVATFLLNNSSLLKGNLLSGFRTYYLQKDRKLVNFLSDCAIYDNELSYTLKPGKFHLKYREFEIDYSVNSIGVRDDEASLIAPELVVIGDSQAMGWSVNQEQTFSSLLQNALGKRVLNAAVSSYGTVRELKILERVNLDSLEYLIIQYCDNDFYENRKFANNNDTLFIMSEDKYKSLVEKHENDIAYYFGKHSLNLTMKLVKKLVSLFKASNSVKKVEDTNAEEVDVFLNAILTSSINLNDVSVIVFEVNSYSRNDSLFIDKLNERLRSEQTIHPVVKNIKAVDFSPILGKDKYFHLDDHINSLGHHAIAESVTELIMSME